MPEVGSVFPVVVFDLRRSAKLCLAVAFLLALAWRFAAAVLSFRLGDIDPATRFGLQVVFPSVLAFLLLAMPPGRSVEGVLMRVGACVQLLFVVLVPRFALPLALGSPVVFLVVELFETWAPRPLRRIVEGALVTTA